MTLLALLLLAQAAPAGTGHDANPVFREVVADGLAVDGATVRLPAPTFADGLGAEAARDTLRAIAGDDRAAREFARDSVTAPIVLKARDVPAAGATVRVVDLWFAVHARLEDVDPDRALRQAEGRPVEAGNMRFESRVVGDDDLRAAGIRPLPPAEGRKEWFGRSEGRLLDRILVESTDRAVATRTADSLLVASRAAPGLDGESKLASRWMTLARKGAEEIRGPARPYSGGASYVKITRLASEPGALLVEAHLAFVEPRDWFGGQPILRSKFGLIAQDRVRGLRHEIRARAGRP